MTTINTIDDLVRILREQPAWAEAVRSLLLTDDLLDLPARFDRFVQSQEETNRSQQETNRRLSELLTQLTEAHEDTRQRLIGLNDRFERFVQSQEETNRRLSQTVAELKEINEDTRQRLTTLEARFDRMEGRFSNYEGEQYERMVRAKALARSQFVLGLDSAYYALTQDGIADPRFMRAVNYALREGRVTTTDSGDLFETDLIISGGDNRHAVFEISLTADDHDIRRARERADILQTITGGAVSPAVITARIDDTRYDQADAQGVTVFVIPYP